MTEPTWRAVQDLWSLPGVVNVGGQVGRAVMSDQIVNVNSGEIWVKVDPGADYDATVAGIRDTVVRYQGVSTDVLTHSAERVTDVLGRSGDDSSCASTARTWTLNAKADEVRGLIAGVGGVARANVDRLLQEPTVEVEVDLARAQEAGVKPGDVRRAAAQLLGGITVGNLFEQQKVFDVVVWGARRDPAERARHRAAADRHAQRRPGPGRRRRRAGRAQPGGDPARVHRPLPGRDRRRRRA